MDELNQELQDKISLITHNLSTQITFLYTGKTHTVMSSDGMCVHVVEKLFKRIKLDKYHDYKVSNQRDSTEQQEQQRYQNQQ